MNTCACFKAISRDFDAGLAELPRQINTVEICVIFRLFICAKLPLPTSTFY